MRKIINYVITVVVWLFVVLKFIFPQFSTGYSSYYIWSNFNLSWVNMLFGISTLILFSAATYLYSKRMKPGFLMAILTITVVFVKALIEAVISVKDIELAREAYLYSREIRGFPVSRDKVETIINSHSAILVIVGIMVVFIALYVLAYFKRKKFTEEFSLPKFIIKN